MKNILFREVIAPYSPDISDLYVIPTILADLKQMLAGKKFVYSKVKNESFYKKCIKIINGDFKHNA